MLVDQNKISKSSAFHDPSWHGEISFLGAAKTIHSLLSRISGLLQEETKINFRIYSQLLFQTSWEHVIPCFSLLKWERLPSLKLYDSLQTSDINSRTRLKELKDGESNRDGADREFMGLNAATNTLYIIITVTALNRKLMAFDLWNALFLAPLLRRY